MDNQIFFCQPNRVKLPASLDVFTYGNTGYLSIHTDDHALDVALAGNAAAVVLALRCAADELEKKLFLQTHREKTRREQLKTIRDWDWLTPEMVIKYFEQSPILAPAAADVRAALSKAIVTPTKAPSQLEQDLSAVQPHLSQIMPNGKVNKSEIARVLNISPGGGKNWPRVTAVAEVISSSTAAHPARNSAGEENALRDAA